jgi:hypothetical protein
VIVIAITISPAASRRRPVTVIPAKATGSGTVRGASIRSARGRSPTTSAFSSVGYGCGDWAGSPTTSISRSTATSVRRPDVGGQCTSPRAQGPHCVP